MPSGKWMTTVALIGEFTFVWLLTFHTWEELPGAFLIELVSLKKSYLKDVPKFLRIGLLVGWAVDHHDSSQDLERGVEGRGTAEQDCTAPVGGDAGRQLATGCQPAV